MCAHLCVHVSVHIWMCVLGRRNRGREDKGPSAFWLLQEKGLMGLGKGPPVGHIKERQRRPLPQAQAFRGSNVPDHSALFLPGFVLHQHQGDISLQHSTDEPGHSELQGREEPEGLGVTYLPGILKDLAGDSARVFPVRRAGHPQPDLTCCLPKWLSPRFKEVRGGN